MQKVILFSILASLYLIPLCKFVHVVLRYIIVAIIGCSPAKPQSDTINLNSKTKFPNILFYTLSRVEYIFQPLRFYFIGIPVMGLTLYLGINSLIQQTSTSQNQFLILLILSLLTMWLRAQKKQTDLRISQFLLLYPDIHPEIFYYKYKMELAFGGISFFDNAQHQIVTPAHADFRLNKRAHFSFLTVVFALIDTAYISHIALNSLNKLGPTYVKNYIDILGSLWGKRILQLTQSTLSVAGAEKLNGTKGRFILIFNHKSALDFIISFFALSQIKVNQRFLRPRFVLAKDHFKDNWFMYQLLGMGRAAEAVDMVFVSRQNMKESAHSLKQAAQFILDKDIDIAIYPQGTRAAGNFDRAKKRRDAGFYTTIRRKDIDSPYAHLKKGTCHLILNTLLEMKEQSSEESLHLVFIGINGTATTLPKGSLKVLTETEITCEIGDVVSLTPSMLDEFIASNPDNVTKTEAHKKFIDELIVLINDKLVHVLGHKKILTQRYLTELKGQFRYDDDKVLMIHKYLAQTTKDNDVLFQILDRTYSLSLPQWNAYLSALTQLLLEKAPLERFEILLKEVTLELLKELKK